MYSQASPRSSRQDMASPGQGVQSPTKGAMALRSGSASSGAMLSPGRTRRRQAGSNQGSRSGSPLTVHMDGAHPQAQNPHSQSTTYSLSQTLMPDGMSGSTGPSPGRSPYQSPAHSRSSSMTSVKSLLRDRSVERAEREHMHDHAHHSHGHSSHRHGSLVRDRSLDRQLDRHHRERDRHTPHYTTRDRSVDRGRDHDYPLMGARSLDRDGHVKAGNLVRSRSIDHEYLANQAAFLPPAQDLRHARDTLILDMQVQIAELNKECAVLHQELDVTRDKLGSSMNSIKTFWSPELKKERVLRKEESARLLALSDQLKITSAENKRYAIAISQMEDDKKHGTGRQSSPASAIGESDTLRREKERQAREVIILRKTIEEMEMRIDTQKATLTARDESIKKLLEMLQSKGLSSSRQEEDCTLEVERLRLHLTEEENKVKRLESILEQRDKELGTLKEDLINFSDEIHHSSSSSLQALVDKKESRIASLEGEVKVLEEELHRLREEGATLSRDSQDNSMQIETLKSHERLMKIKLENVKAEAQRRETEACALRTQMETLEKQGADQKRHIGVLKEQVSAKDQQITMLQADLESLRHRLEEKEVLIDKKGKQVLCISAEKKRIDGEVHELRDHIEIKERKISVLQRKIDNLDEMLKDREGHIDTLKTKLRTLHADQSSSEGAVSTLEETIAEREKQIDRLKEQREVMEREHADELEHYQQTTKDIKKRIEELQVQLDEKQNEVLELREELSETQSDKIRKDSQINKVDVMLAQKTSEISSLQAQIRQLENENARASKLNAAAAQERSGELEKSARAAEERVGQAQSEVDRLLDILREMEEEKHAKDNTIKELQDKLKDAQQKVGTLKRSQNVEKKKSAQLLEEARKREDNVTGDASQLKSDIRQKADRIEELEEALRESVKITAQREMVMAQQQIKIEQAEKQVKALTAEMEQKQKNSTTTNHQVEQLNKQLEQHNEKLRLLQDERRTHLEEAYEMKQEAILAAISEKDAHLAVLETTGTRKQHQAEIDRLNKDKERLQQQLKELTQSRMKLLQNHDGHSNDNSLANKMSKSSTDQVIQAIRKLEYNKKRLSALIDQLVATCLEIDQDMLAGLPRVQQDQCMCREALTKLHHHQLLQVLRGQEEDCNRLRCYANDLLERIHETQPESLKHVMQWLDKSVQT